MKKEIIFLLATIIVCAAFLIWKYNAVMALDLPTNIKWLLLFR
jgi:hypothetical protein